MPPPLLEIANLSVDFKTANGLVRAVRTVSFTIRPNEVVAVVGESGSGKSVTALSIMGLLPPPDRLQISGEIRFSRTNGKTINILSASGKELTAVRGKEIGMIFQEPMTSLNPVYTCGHQVRETLVAHHACSRGEAKQKTIEWFEKVKLPDPEIIYDKYPHQLSGGQKQRVMIAMAMSCNPSLLICDEPTTALDVTVQKTILQLIKELQQQTGMAVLFITHDLGVVAEIAGRCIVMYKGTIAEENNIEKLFNRPEHPYTKGLLACRPANHKKGDRLPVVSDFLRPDTAAAVQPPGTPPEENSSAVKKEKLLEVNNLVVRFEGRRNFWGHPAGYIKAVDDVSFTVWKGETLGLVGESGCGKTTLGRCLLQLIRPSGGNIIYNGTDLSGMNAAALKPLRKEIQIVFQDPYSSLNPRIRIGEALSEPLEVHRHMNRQQRKELVTEMLRKVDLLPDHFNRYPHEFSGGQRQRIVIARALILHPSFIVCDESVSALDVSVQAQVLNLLNDLKKEFGFTVIFISHDLSVVHYISDRIMVMHRGKIVEQGTADEIYLHPKENYTKKLIASIPGINP